MARATDLVSPSLSLSCATHASRTSRSCSLKTASSLSSALAVFDVAGEIPSTSVADDEKVDVGVRGEPLLGVGVSGVRGIVTIVCGEVTTGWER